MIQYIPVQVVCSIVIFITSLTGQYHEGHFAANDVYIYTAFAINCSQIMALYALVLFYQALKVELAPCRPFSKFLCIKLVVFFTFWQSVFLSMLVAVGAIEPTVTYNTNQESYGIGTHTRTHLPSHPRSPPPPHHLTTPHPLSEPSPSLCSLSPRRRLHHLHRDALLRHRPLVRLPSA